MPIGCSTLMMYYIDMNILVTGANGQLGHEMQRVSLFSNNNYLFTDVEELDITDYNAILAFMKRENVNVIVNCAAYTNVDKAEDDEDNAFLINATAVENLARAAKANNATLIHVSTDYVFRGDANIPYREDVETNLPALMVVLNLRVNKKFWRWTVITLFFVLLGYIPNGVIISSKQCCDSQPNATPLMLSSTKLVLLRLPATSLMLLPILSIITYSIKKVYIIFLTRAFVLGSISLPLSLIWRAISALLTLFIAMNTQVK